MRGRPPGGAVPGAGGSGLSAAALRRVDWMLLYQGMVVLAACQVWWTWEVEDVFQQVQAGEKHAMKSYGRKMHRQIDELVTRITMQLGKNDRKKYNTVLIIDVHARDIVDSFIRGRWAPGAGASTGPLRLPSRRLSCPWVSASRSPPPAPSPLTRSVSPPSILEAQEFEWESQLRFYWDREPDELNIRQCTGTFGYGYEYMGLNGRLVITPLTDRIYLTLTQVTGQRRAVGSCGRRCPWACVFPTRGRGDGDRALGCQCPPQGSCPVEPQNAALLRNRVRADLVLRGWDENILGQGPIQCLVSV